MLYAREQARLKAILGCADRVILWSPDARAALRTAPPKWHTRRSLSDVPRVLESCRVMRIENGTEEVLHVEGRARSGRKFRIGVSLRDDDQTVKIVSVD